MSGLDPKALEEAAFEAFCVGAHHSGASGAFGRGARTSPGSFWFAVAKAAVKRYLSRSSKEDEAMVGRDTKAKVLEEVIDYAACAKFYPPERVAEVLRSYADRLSRLPAGGRDLSDEEVRAAARVLASQDHPVGNTVVDHHMLLAEDVLRAARDADFQSADGPQEETAMPWHPDDVTTEEALAMLRWAELNGIDWENLWPLLNSAVANLRALAGRDT